MPGRRDIACEDLGPWGISQAYVIGDDEYRFDVDGDGTGCETELPRQATPVGDSWANAAPVALPAMLVIVGIGILVGSRYLHRLYREADSSAEQRALKASVMLSLILIVPAAIIGALALAVVGLD